MDAFRKEQKDALSRVREYIHRLSEEATHALQSDIAAYLRFRHETRRFLGRHFHSICTRSCYENRLSACCSKDGVIIFFGDVVVNALTAPETALDRMAESLEKKPTDFKCVFLGREGCLWGMKPIVCEMFLCDKALSEAFSGDPSARSRWGELREMKKRFTWPDRPVLFESLEHVFITAGYSSPLMHLHNSPGLIRVKREAIRKGTYFDAR